MAGKATPQEFYKNISYTTLISQLSGMLLYTTSRVFSQEKTGLSPSSRFAFQAQIEEVRRQCLKDRCLSMELRGCTQVFFQSIQGGGGESICARWNKTSRPLIAMSTFSIGGMMSWRSTPAIIADW